jgi:hypothetical protein
MSISFDNVFAKLPPFGVKKNDDDNKYWSNDAPIDDNTLYRLDEAKEIDSATWARFKKMTLNWLEGDIIPRSLQYMDAKQLIPESHKKLIMKCTEELFDLVYETHNHRMYNKIIQSIAAACFLISIKLFYADDYIRDGSIIEVLVRRSGGGVTTTNLLELEKNIMKKTDWKGCGTYSIDKIYDDDVDPTWMFGKTKKSAKKTKKSAKKTKKSAKKTKKSAKKTKKSAKKTKKSAKKTKK